MSPPPERAPAKVVPLIIPPSAATATAPLAPGAAPAAATLVTAPAPPQTYTPSAKDLCAVLVGRLDPSTELAQMASGEWQGEFQDFFYKSLANGTAAEFYGCVLAALQSQGVDPRKAVATLAPLVKKVSDDFATFPPPPSAQPPTVATPPPTDPDAPQIIPTDPIPPYGPLTELPRPAPGAMVPTGPGGVILAASDDGLSQKQWGMIAIAVLVVGGAAYYYARR